jgi:hypothetical protein
MTDEDTTQPMAAEIIDRFELLETPLMEAVAWAGIIDKLVEHDLPLLAAPNQARHEQHKSAV